MSSGCDPRFDHYHKHQKGPNCPCFACFFAHRFWNWFKPRLKLSVYIGVFSPFGLHVAAWIWLATHRDPIEAQQNLTVAWFYGWVLVEIWLLAKWSQIREERQQRMEAKRGREL